jgi:hypothetical protein
MSVGIFAIVIAGVRGKSNLFVVQSRINAQGIVCVRSARRSPYFVLGMSVLFKELK